MRREGQSTKMRRGYRVLARIRHVTHRRPSIHVFSSRYCTITWRERKIQINLEKKKSSYWRNNMEGD